MNIVYLLLYPSARIVFPPFFYQSSQSRLVRNAKAIPTIFIQYFSRIKKKRILRLALSQTLQGQKWGSLKEVQKTKKAPKPGKKLIKKSFVSVKLNYIWAGKFAFAKSLNNVILSCTRITKKRMMIR